MIEVHLYDDEIDVGEYEIGFPDVMRTQDPDDLVTAVNMAVWFVWSAAMCDRRQAAAVFDDDLFQIGFTTQRGELNIRIAFGALGEADFDLILPEFPLPESMN